MAAVIEDNEEEAEEVRKNSVDGLGEFSWIFLGVVLPSLACCVSVVTVTVGGAAVVFVDAVVAGIVVAVNDDDDVDGVVVVCKFGNVVKEGVREGVREDDGEGVLDDGAEEDDNSAVLLLLLLMLLLLPLLPVTFVALFSALSSVLRIFEVRDISKK